MALTQAGAHTRTPLRHEAPAGRVPSVGRMGKGARNRAKRAKEAEYAAAREAAREAIGELLLVESFDDYVGILGKHPELGSREAADELDEASNAPGYGPLFARARVLLDGARSGDLAAAWEAHRKAADEAQRLVDAVEPLQAEADGAMEAGDYARVLEIVDEALPVAVQTGFGLGVCLLLDSAEWPSLNSAGPNRADELEGAIEAFRAALEVSVSGAQLAGVLMHLGLAFGERIHDDRADNIETALAALGDALAELDGSPDRDDELRAMILTNLSVFLGGRNARIASLSRARPSRSAGRRFVSARLNGTPMIGPILSSTSARRYAA